MTTDKTAGLTLEIEPPAPFVQDNPTASEILAEGVSGAVLANGLAKVNLISSRFNLQTQRVEYTVVARLAMPVPSFLALRDALVALTKKWEAEGHLSIQPEKPQ